MIINRKEKANKCYWNKNFSYFLIKYKENHFHSLPFGQAEANIY